MYSINYSFSARVIKDVYKIHEHVQKYKIRDEINASYFFSRGPQLLQQLFFLLNNNIMP